MKDFIGHKTIKVQNLRLCINKLLANKKICESEKIGYCFLLERVLFDTNNYKGKMVLLASNKLSIKPINNHICIYYFTKG